MSTAHERGYSDGVAEGMRSDSLFCYDAIRRDWGEVLNFGPHNAEYIGAYRIGYERGVTYKLWFDYGIERCLLETRVTELLLLWIDYEEIHDEQIFTCHGSVFEYSWLFDPSALTAGPSSAGFRRHLYVLSKM